MDLVSLGLGVLVGIAIAVSVALLRPICSRREQERRQAEKEAFDAQVLQVASVKFVAEHQKLIEQAIAPLKAKQQKQEAARIKAEEAQDKKRQKNREDYYKRLHKNHYYQALVATGRYF